MAAGHGWTAAGLEGPTFPPGTCHVGSARYRGEAQPLPDRRCTPGATDPAVTAGNLLTTICRRGGYTSSVRPPASLTDRAKRSSAAAYAIAGSLAGYEYDHLVPLGLGGASSTLNLWPERDVGGSGGFDINAKDQVEDVLHEAVCSGRVPLAEAQRAVAIDWTTALTELGAS